MLIPLHDANRLRFIRTPRVTRGLILVNFAIWLVMLPSGMAAFADHLVLMFGFIPAIVSHNAALPDGLQGVPPALTYVSYAFLHGNFAHVGLNMLFLWIFGDNVEDALGHFRFLVFYLACAAAGALAHQMLATDPEAPLIGASGAISGVVVAYAILHPHVRLWVLVLFGIPLPLPAYVPLAFWVGEQFFELATSGGAGISFAAHVGGIVAGGVLVVFLRRRGVPLFDAGLPLAAPPQSGDMTPADKNDSQPPSSPAHPPRWGR